jgi:pyruvate ferredoxin oxidoreductase beta subunit
MSAITADDSNKELFACGHRGCAGCGEGTAVRMVLNTAGPNTVLAICTGCLEVMTTAYPETAWEVPIIHAAFENGAAVASGVESALKALGKREGVNVLAFGGDGGTFDIGLQALSGMLERRHNIKYFCFDNEAYMNTGIQRCSSTPYGATTTTSPSGKYSIGESRDKKPIGAIAAAHDIPYTATATIAYPKDLKRKVQRALEIEGPTFMHIFTPCPTGWRYPSEQTVELSRLAVQTGVFLLWELEGADFRNIKINKKLPNRKPVTDYLKLQGRFRHIMKNEEVLQEIQKMVDDKCEMYGI